MRSLYRWEGTVRFFRNHPWLFRGKTGQVAQREAWRGLVWVRVVRRELAETRAQLRAALRPRAPTTYLGAVAYLERYFGPQPFLRSCPSGEGGYGRWVANTRGSGAGGWLQFMSGTFYGIIDEAIRDARDSGVYVPDSARSWYSPLGQALAGRQMLLDGRRSEWAGRNC